MTAWEVTTLSMVAGVWLQFWIFWQLAADWLLRGSSRSVWSRAAAVCSWCDTMLYVGSLSWQ